MKRLLLAVILLLATLLILRRFEMAPSSFTWLGAPAGAALEPDIKKAWMAEPSYFSSLTQQVTANRGEKTSVEVRNPKVGQENYGRMQVVSPPGGSPSAEDKELALRTLSYWPVKVTLRTVFKSGGSDPAKQTITTETAPYTCYAYKDKEGLWKVTFRTPRDLTPSYKIW